MKRFTTIAIAWLLMAAAPAISPKLECDELAKSLLPDIEKLLAANGKFTPIGATLSASGKIAREPGPVGTAAPKSAAAIERLHQRFATGARAGRYRATAVAYDVQIAQPGAGGMTDAVAMELDHRDDYSVVVFRPYTVKNGRVEFGPPQSNPGRSAVFGARPRQ